MSVSDGHGIPPFSAGMQDRSLGFSPATLPHGSLQAPHAPQSPHEKSTVLRCGEESYELFTFVM